MSDTTSQQEWGAYISGPSLVGWVLMMTTLHGKPIVSTSKDLIEETAARLQGQRPYHTVKAMLVQEGDKECAGWGHTANSRHSTGSTTVVK